MEILCNPYVAFKAYPNEGTDLTDTHKDKYEDKDKDIQEEDAPEEMHQR